MLPENVPHLYKVGSTYSHAQRLCMQPTLTLKIITKELQLSTTSQRTSTYFLRTQKCGTFNFQLTHIKIAEK